MKMVEPVKLKVQADLVDGWKKMETDCHVESVHLAASVGEEELCQSSDVVSFLRKSSALFSSSVTKSFDVCSSRS